jgi:hypothetical protein
MKVSVAIFPPADGPMKLRTAQGEVRNGDVGRFVLKPDEVCLGIQTLGRHFRIRERLGRGLPIRDVRDNRLVHADAHQGHSGFRFKGGFDLECVGSNLDGRPLGPFGPVAQRAATSAAVLSTTSPAKAGPGIETKRNRRVARLMVGTPSCFLAATH